MKWKYFISFVELGQINLTVFSPGDMLKPDKVASIYLTARPGNTIVFQQTHLKIYLLQVSDSGYYLLLERYLKAYRWLEASYADNSIVNAI